jgi:hypothetical protein
MTPTAKLRWLVLPLGAEREGAVPAWNGPSVRVLQQWWEGPYLHPGEHPDFPAYKPTGEWRDIEIAREE